MRGFRLLLLAPWILSPALAAGPPPADWSPEQQREILDSTLTVRLAPDLSGLGAGERAAVDELIAVGEILQRVYEDSRHPQALAERARIEQLNGTGEGLRTLFRIFQGPIATTPDNRRVPFLAVEPEQPGRNFYPPGMTEEELRAFLGVHPELESEILGERTVVRRTAPESLAADLRALERHPVLAGLHPALGPRLRELAASPSAPAFYAVPYAVAWADEMVAAQLRLFRAADAVEPEDPEFARYLRNRGRDLLSNDYESGDASWVTGRFRRLDAQIGAYETYDDALFGVKASHGLSLLLRDEVASAELSRGLEGLQEVEDALPTPEHKRVRADIPVGVFEVIADFGQARGTNTATILPNDPLFSSRYGRTILLRGNILRDPQLGELAARRWRAAVVPALADELAPEGQLQRTLWHEVGHYLGPERTRDGRPLDQALRQWADALEELKADLVSLFTIERFHRAGRVDDSRLQAVRASGIYRTLQSVRPRRDQPYQTMQLVQFNYFLDRGLLAWDGEGRLEVRPELYESTVRALLAEVMDLQVGGDPGAAEAFFERWTRWEDDRHGELAARLRGAGGPRYRLVLYSALGDPDQG